MKWVALDLFINTLSYVLETVTRNRNQKTYREALGQLTQDKLACTHVVDMQSL